MGMSQSNHDRFTRQELVCPFGASHTPKFFLSCISGIFNQCSLQMNTSTRKDGLSSIGGSTVMQSAEATCLSLCSLAEQHADRVS